jgi:hypothetical protein
MTRSTRYALAALMTVALGACDQQKPVANDATGPSPTTDVAGSGGPALAYVGRWASQTSPTAVATLSSCSNFQWNVTSQTATTMTGQFSAVCLGMYQVTGTASGQLDGGVAHIVLNASTTLPNVGACPVTLTSDATLDGDLIRLPYNAQTCLGNYSGTETLRKSQLLPQPSPEPQPEPPPPSSPPPSGPDPVTADEIDLSQVTYVLGPSNVGAWPRTSTMTATRAVPHELCTYHTKLGQWPSTLFFDTDALVEGNQWVFANIGGRWYGGAGEWQRPGQACKDVTAESIGADAFYNPNQEPLRSWVPRQGEVFGLMVTTPARAWPNMRTLDERSNVVLVRWGS